MSDRDPGAPFQWGLTPGEPVEPVPPVDPTPPVEPTPPVVAPPPAFPQPPIFPPPLPTFPPAPPIEPDLPPTAAFTMPADLPPAAFPYAGQDLQPLPPDPRWATPLDYSLDGGEVIEAEIVGLETPEGEGVEASALDDLFGATQFKEYADELITAPPLRAPGGGSGGAAKPPKGPRGALPRNQKILMGVAGGLVAVLALIALFLVGTRLSAALGPAPAIVTPSPSPSASFIVLPLGPVDPGDYQWDELLGGECLKPFESAWQDRYTVVDCAVPHPAQMVYRGTFDDEADALYPGVEELQKRINLLCTAPTIIDYAKAGSANDIQVEASFAVDSVDWDDGNRTYFCFVSRSSGDDLTVSIAMPQVAPTPTATPAG